VLVDYSNDLLTELKESGKKPNATGKCRVNDADKFEFESAAAVKIDKVVKLLAEARRPARRGAP